MTKVEPIRPSLEDVFVSLTAAQEAARKGLEHMRWHRLAAIVRKEVIQISRDLPSLLIIVAMPLLLMLAFGYGVRFDIQHIPVYVYDREGSQQSQDFLKHFQASEYFDVVNDGGQLSGADSGARRRRTAGSRL